LIPDISFHTVKITLISPAQTDNERATLTCAFFAFVSSTFSSFFRCFLAIGLTWLSRITWHNTCQSGSDKLNYFEMLLPLLYKKPYL